MEHPHEPCSSAGPFWCDCHLEITVEGPEGQFRKRLKAPFARLGSHPASDLVLSGAGIARRSVYLHATPGGLWCIPLCDTTEEDGPPHGWVSEDETLRMGLYKIRIVRKSLLLAPDVAAMDLESPGKRSLRRSANPRIRVGRGVEHAGHETQADHGGE